MSLPPSFSISELPFEPKIPWGVRIFVEADETSEPFSRQTRGLSNFPPRALQSDDAQALGHGDASTRSRCSESHRRDRYRCSGTEDGGPVGEFARGVSSHQIERELTRLILSLLLRSATSKPSTRPGLTESCSLSARSLSPISNSTLLIRTINDTRFVQTFVLPRRSYSTKVSTPFPLQIFSSLLLVRPATFRSFSGDLQLSAATLLIAHSVTPESLASPELDRVWRDLAELCLKSRSDDVQEGLASVWESVSRFNSVEEDVKR